MGIPRVLVSNGYPRNDGKEAMKKQSDVKNGLKFGLKFVGQGNGVDMKQEPEMLSNLDTMTNVLILVGLNVAGATILKNVLEVGNIFRLPSFFRNQLSGQGSSVIKLALFFLRKNYQRIQNIAKIMLLQVFYANYLLELQKLASYVPYNLIALKIERLMLKKQMSEKLGLICYHIILTVLLSMPVIFCMSNDMHRMLRGVIAATTCYTFLKLISYYQVNSQQRSAYFRKEYETKKDDKEQKTTDGLNYPDNLTPKNSLYYTYLPTFCYKISFPKRKKIELKIIAREVLEALLQFEIIANIYEHIWPIIHKHFEEDWGLTNFSNLHHVILHFRYVALIAVPITLAAILLNYALFFKVLKVIGELLRYDCGSFCGPWWRMTNVKDYWANWNYAVQNWMRDHLYKPLRRKGVPQVIGLYAVFIVSGVLHDYVIGVALAYNTGLILTICFVSSVPYVIFSPIVSKYVEPYGRHLGNLTIISMWYYSTVFGFSCMYKIKYAQ